MGGLVVGMSECTIDSCYHTIFYSKEVNMNFEGLSDERIKSFYYLEPDEYPTGRLFDWAEKLVDQLDEPYSHDELVAGEISKKRTLRMCHIMLRLFNSGIMEGEDRAVSRIAEVMKGGR
jgi:hypothetical protein